MASTTVKSTYSLDVETVRALDAMARRWKVSKSEALRRAIRAAAELAPDASTDAVAALDALQATLNLDADAATQWDKQVRGERRAGGRRLRQA